MLVYIYMFLERLKLPLLDNDNSKALRPFLQNIIYNINV